MWLAVVLFAIIFIFLWRWALKARARKSVNASLEVALKFLASSFHRSEQEAEALISSAQKFGRRSYHFFRALMLALVYFYAGIAVMSGLSSPPKILSYIMPASWFETLGQPEVWRDTEIALAIAFFIYSFMEIMIFFTTVKRLITEELADNLVGKLESSRQTAINEVKDEVKDAFMLNPTSLNRLDEDELDKLHFNLINVRARETLTQDNSFYCFLRDDVESLIARPYIASVRYRIWLKLDNVDGHNVVRVRRRDIRTYKTLIDSDVVVRDRVWIEKYKNDLQGKDFNQIYQNTSIKVAGNRVLAQWPTLYEHATQPPNFELIDNIGLNAYVPKFIDHGDRLESLDLFPPITVPISTLSEAGTTVIQKFEAILPSKTIIRQGVGQGQTLRGTVNIEVSFEGADICPNITVLGFGETTNNDPENNSRTVDWSGIMIPGHGFIVSWPII